MIKIIKSRKAQNELNYNYLIHTQIMSKSITTLPNYAEKRNWKYIHYF